MPTPMAITAAADPRLDDYRALTDAALRKRYEHQRGVLIAEGPNPVRELVASPYPLRSVLIAEERLDAFEDVVAAAAAAGADVFAIPRDVLYDVVRFRLHQGVIACGQRIPAPDVQEIIDGARRVAVLEGLNDHENLGALFRSARGLGIDAVLLGPGCADPLYRRSVRVSMGHVLHVPHAWLPDLDAGLGALHRAGFVTVALTPEHSAQDLGDIDVDPRDRVAVLLGAEGPGLTDAALAGARLRGRIPMHGRVDSINVAAAAAIAFHTLGRR